MGSNASTNFLSESELSMEESDSEFFKSSCDEERTDAALRSEPTPNWEKELTIKKVEEIEQTLDKYDIVSLVYLLYDSSKLALQKLEEFLSKDVNHGLLKHWADFEQHNGNKWQQKFIESFCIIQNYKVLIELGYEKTYLIATYLPHRSETSVSVNRIRKALYLICEKLSQDQTSSLIRFMENNTKVKELQFKKHNEAYLELYFLDWEGSQVAMECVKHAFKYMNLESLYDIMVMIIGLKNIVVSPVPPNTTLTANQLSEGKAKETRKDTTNVQQSTEGNSFRFAEISERVSQSRDDNIYPIDPNNPGVLLIINQEYFYTETDPEYQYLLHPNNNIIKLETRDGTNKDKIKLQTVFQKFGFKIVVAENLPHYDLLDTVRKETEKITTESSFIVSILSHGDNGIIYGANSCKVDVSQIQSIMCRKNKLLQGKPKVLILQSCQGTQCQQIDEADEYATDGPMRVLPPTVDLLIFWATIPGYAAVRNVKKGSWLIQTLCDEIEAATPRNHLLDICTRVTNVVTTKKWREKTGINVMTPMVKSTFRKSFYLPPMRYS